MKPLISITFLTLISFLFPTKILSQFITQHKNKFSYQDVEYDREELSMVLSQSSQASLYYQNAKRTRSLGKKHLIVGSSLIGSTIIISSVIVIGDKDSFVSPLGFVMMAVSGISVTLLSVNYYYKAKKNINAAINHYNWEVQEKLSKQKSLINIDLTINGLGLVITF